MINKNKATCIVGFLMVCSIAFCRAQPNSVSTFSLTVLSDKATPVERATVELLKANKIVKAVVTNEKGIAIFTDIAAGDYTLSVSCTGYSKQVTANYHFPSPVNAGTINLRPLSTSLQEVRISASRPYLEQKPGKTVLNVDASVTNVGTTVLEVLEKSPGVTVDRNGGISLMGKPNVLVMIDDKPTYLSGDDLNNLLSSMSSGQVDQIELITNPSAKYDASGNAGIINIKTKKNKAKGFNGTFSTSAGQGVYSKTTNNLILNYRAGKINTFFNYSMNLNDYFLNLYALRKYYDSNGALIGTLDEPSYFKGFVFNNSIKAGLDYYITPKTTLGIVLGGTSIHRTGNNSATASWLNPTGAADSAIITTSKNDNKFKNGTININGTHTFSPSQDISANFDWLHYSTRGEQDFNNQLLAQGGYNQQSRGIIPTTINIVSGKVDYTQNIGKEITFQSGFKSSNSSTDNVALYQNFDGINWIDDNTKTNHFLYSENVNALYGDIEQKKEHLTLKAGLRYEHTNYKANQLGNAIQKDSAFSRNYGGLFPSAFVSYQADTANSFSLSAGRRLDRPAFQNLNPFYNVINKYTYQTGNPFLLPQYTWNFALGHQYKNLLNTSVSYSIINNYFSQLFLADTAKGILLYSQGNVGHVNNLGLSSTLTVSPFKWWSATTQAVFNHKQFVGFNGNNYSSKSNQLNLNTNNQFTLGNDYTAEVIAAYTTRARVDIQEQLYPTGQVSIGIARPVLKKKGTLRLSARDIFYTTVIEGLTQFPNATEYFLIKRDTRVLNISFTYRFGKSYKTTKRAEDSAKEEAERAGNG